MAYDGDRKMKLLRYGPPGKERPGLLDSKGAIRNLSGVLGDIDGDALAGANLERLAAIDSNALPVVTGQPRLAVPVAAVPKFIAIGVNYRDHAIEAKMAIPTEPVVFMKATTSLSGPHEDVIRPKYSTKMDWEV